MGQYQEVLAWGWLAWSSCTDSGIMPQYCEAIGELGVAQISCAERCLLIRTNAGKVFTVYYSSETQVRFISRIKLKYRNSITEVCICYAEEISDRQTYIQLKNKPISFRVGANGKSVRS